MFDRQSRHTLRALSVCALASCALVFGVRLAAASDTQAHVDASAPNAQPPYPDSAMASGEQGTVLIGVYIRKSGRVEKYHVTQSSGFGDLDNAAVETVLNWHYVPATRDGEKVSDWTTVKVQFQLPQPAAATPPTAVKY